MFKWIENENLLLTELLDKYYWEQLCYEIKTRYISTREGIWGHYSSMKNDFRFNFFIFSPKTSYKLQYMHMHSSYTTVTCKIQKLYSSKENKELCKLTKGVFKLQFDPLKFDYK